MKKKRFFQFLAGVLFFIIGLGIGISRVGPAGNSQIREVGILDAARSILSFEPAKVKALRNRTYEEDPNHPEYYFHLLSKDEQRVYREMLEGVRAWDPEFYLTSGEDEEIDKAYQAVINDHPEIYWVRNHNPVYKTMYGGRNYCLFAPGYSYLDEEDGKKDKKQVSRINKAIKRARKRVKALIPEQADDYQKIEAVYTYLIDHTDYVESEDDQSIAGVFWKKEAVCAGYASAMQYLLDMLGVECIYVEGTSKDSKEGHAWNIVRIDGEYYYVDVTNADQPEFLVGDAASLKEHKTILMDYLCPFPWEYESLYQPDETFELPVCRSTDMNFYVLNNGYFTDYDPDELNSYFHMRIDNGAVVIRYKFSDQEVFEESEADWPYTGQLEEAIQYYMISHGLTQIQYHFGALSHLNTVYYIF